MALADHDTQWRWFIDAWFPADGIVFISLRTSRADIWQETNGEPDTEGRPAVAMLLRAPEFEPEPIERRIAFGAVQRGGQEGFSLDGEGEFAFESIEQVGAFVRRVYAGSGPADTTGGAGPAPAPRDPEPDNPDAPWPELDLEQGPDAEADWSLKKDVSEDKHELERRMVAGCSATVRRSAANLLISSVSAVFDQTGRPDRLEAVMPLLQAAMLLTAEDRDFWSQRFVQALRRDRRRTLQPGELSVVLMLVADFFDPYPLQRLPWPDSARSHMVRWRLPGASAHRLLLPAQVDSWLDALCYLRADRRYLSGTKFSQWGALLLALTAPLVIARAEAWAVWPPARALPVPWLVPIARCMQMAVELLPAEALPASLEDNIERWCRRAGPSAAPPPAQQPPPVNNPPSGSPPPATRPPDRPQQGPALTA